MYKLISLKVMALALCLGFGPASADDKKPALVPAAAYSKLPFAWQVEFTPSGHEAAFLTPTNGRSGLAFTSNNKTKVRLIPPPEGAEIKWFRWANDRYLLISFSVTRLEYGNRYVTTRLYSFDTKDPKYIRMLQPSERDPRDGLVTRGFPMRGNIGDSIVDMLPSDNNNILMEADNLGEGNYGIYKVNVTHGRPKIYKKDRTNIQSWTLDEQNEPRLAGGYKRAKYQLHYLAPGANNWIDATQTVWHKEGFDFLRFFDDPRYAYMRAPNDNGVNGVVKYDMKTDTIVETIFQHDRYDATGLATDFQSGKVIGVRYTHHSPDVFYMDKDYSLIYRSLKKAMPGAHIRIMSYNKQSQQAVLHITSKQQPGAYFTYDRKKGVVNPLYYDVDQRIEATYIQSKPVTYTSRDNKTIEGYLTLPKGSAKGKNLPTIVMPHGGPRVRDTIGYRYDVQFLVNRGYAVFQPNFRGSTGYGDRFRSAGYKQWGGLMQDDVTDGTKWLIEQGIADKDRICIMGGSYGGYAALMGPIKEQGLYKCAISLNGVTDIGMTHDEDRNYIGGAIWTKSIGNKNLSDAKISPLQLSDDLKIPVLLVATKDDATVSFKQSKALYNRLKRDIDIRYTEIKEGGHSLESEQSRLAYLQAVEDFLKDIMPTGRLK